MSIRINFVSPGVLTHVREASEGALPSVQFRYEYRRFLVVRLFRPSHSRLDRLTSHMEAYEASVLVQSLGRCFTVH